jgi:hypothetical protein
MAAAFIDRSHAGPADRLTEANQTNKTGRGGFLLWGYHPGTLACPGPIGPPAIAASREY